MGKDFLYNVIFTSRSSVVLLIHHLRYGERVSIIAIEQNPEHLKLIYVCKIITYGYTVAFTK